MVFLARIQCFAARQGLCYRARGLTYAYSARRGSCRRTILKRYAPICDNWHFPRETGPVSLESAPSGHFREAETMLDRRGGYEYEDLLACGRGELFGPGNAQLPLPPMLMFDRITEISETGGEYGKGIDSRRTRREPGPLVLRLPFQGRSGDAGLSRPRCAVADGRLLSGLDRRRGPRPGVGPRRAEVLRPGDAERPQDCVQRRHQARDASKALCWASPTAGFRPTARLSIARRI